MNKSVLLIVCLFAFSMFSVTAFAHTIYPICIGHWQCGFWGPCSYGTQYRFCWDNCGHWNWEFRSCPPPCIPNWQCGEWSECTGGSQERTCLDGCGNSNIETQSCTMPPIITPPSGPTEEELANQQQQLIQRRMMEALMPDKTHDCQMETFIPAQCKPSYSGTATCVLPKKVLTICWNWVTEEYKQSFVQNPFGDYIKDKEWTSWKWTITWWKLQ